MVTKAPCCGGLPERTLFSPTVPGDNVLCLELVRKTPPFKNGKTNFWYYTYNRGNCNFPFPYYVQLWNGKKSMEWYCDSVLFILQHMELMILILSGWWKIGIAATTKADQSAP